MVVPPHPLPGLNGYVGGTFSAQFSSLTAGMALARRSLETGSQSSFTFDSIIQVNKLTYLQGEQIIKGTNVLTSDFSDLPCLLQLYNRLQLSDYRKF